MSDRLDCVSDCAHVIKQKQVISFCTQVWIDYAPAVSGKPELYDVAHEARYAECLEDGDYVGCYEVGASECVCVHPCFCLGRGEEFHTS